MSKAVIWKRSESSEISLPELFPVNNRKLGKIVLVASKPVVFQLDLSNFVSCQNTSTEFSASVKPVPTLLISCVQNVPTEVS